LVRIGPTAWPFTGFIHTDIHTDRQLDKYILDCFSICATFKNAFLFIKAKVYVVN
jgi:hypothetical protein